MVRVRDAIHWTTFSLTQAILRSRIWKSKQRQHNFRMDVSGILFFCAKLCFFHREKLYIGTDVSLPFLRLSTSPRESQTAAENFYWKHQTWPNRLVILTITWYERISNDFLFALRFRMLLRRTTTQIKSPWKLWQSLSLTSMISQPWNEAVKRQIKMRLKMSNWKSLEARYEKLMLFNLTLLTVRRSYTQINCY